MEKQTSPSATIRDAEAVPIDFRGPFMYHPHPMWIYAIDTYAFLEVNESAVRHYGYSRDEFLSMTILDLRPEADIPVLLETLSKPREGGQALGEWRHKLKNGTVIDVEITSFHIDYNGRRAALVTAHDITERKRTEETLRQSELRLRSLLNTFPYLVWIKDIDGRFLSVNQPFVQAFNQKSIEDVLGKTDFDITNHELAANYVAADHEVIATGQRKSVEEEIIDNATRKWFETHKSPMFDEHGTIIGTAGFARDMTDRKIAEQKIRDSERLLKESQEISGIGSYVFDNMTRRWRASEVLEKMWGLSIGVEHTADEYFSTVHPDDQNLVKAYFVKNVAEKQQQFELQYRIINHETSEERWVHSLGRMEFDIAGAPVSLTGTIQDITERRRVEEELRQSEEKFRRVFYTSPDAITVNRIADGLFISINKGFTQLSGYTEEDVIGHTSFEINIWERFDDRKRLIEELKKAGVVENIEARFRTKSGRTITGLLSSAIIEINGEPCTIIIMRDITEHKQTEQLLRDVQRRESIGVLSSGIAHDFNNLLGIMMGNVSLAQKYLSEDHPAMLNLRKSISAMERAAELTQQMLAYSGKGKFQIRSIDVAAVVQEHVSLFTVSLAKNVKLVTHLPAAPVHVNGDPGQIEQIIMNLIINGSDAIGEKPGVVSITLAPVEMTSRELIPFGRITNTILKEGTYARLEVSDNGAGMSRETMNKIFDPFFTTKFTGRGLGLSAVLGIIRGHEGGLTLESTEGEGTTFRIILPVCAPPELSADVTTEKPREELSRSTTVLVIDDEEDIATMAKEILETVNYSAIVSINPVDGIEMYKARHHEIGLVLLDLTMPEMSGKSVVEALQAIDPKVKIVITSGYTEDEVSKRIGTLSVSSFIQKPYRVQTLVSIVETVLR